MNRPIVSLPGASAASGPAQTGPSGPAQSGSAQSGSAQGSSAQGGSAPHGSAPHPSTPHPSTPHPSTPHPSTLRTGAVSDPGRAASDAVAARAAEEARATPGPESPGAALAGAAPGGTPPASAPAASDTGTALPVSPTPGLAAAQADPFGTAAVGRAGAASGTASTAAAAVPAVAAPGPDAGRDAATAQARGTRQSRAHRRAERRAQRRAERLEKGRTLGLRVGPAQVVSWQLALVAVGLAAGHSPPTLVGTALAALVLLAATTVTVRGTVPCRWAAIAGGYLLRRRRIELPELGAAPVLLEPCLGPATFGGTVVRDRPLALLSDRRATSAVLRLTLAADGTGVGSALSALLQGGAPEVAEEPPVDVVTQVVVHTGLRRDRRPRAWLALGARRSPDLCHDEHLALVVRNGIRRLQRHAERLGLTAVPLDDRDAATTLVALAHAGGGRRHVRERWTSWSTGPVVQACLRLRGFSGLDPATAVAVVETLIATPVNAAVTVSITTCTPAASPLAASASPSGGTSHPRPTGVEPSEPIVRVAAASTGALDVATTVLGRLARAYGVEPERLDGRHGPGSAASLPIARTLL